MGSIWLFDKYFHNNEGRIKQLEAELAQLKKAG